MHATADGVKATILSGLCTQARLTLSLVSLQTCGEYAELGESLQRSCARLE